MITFNFQVSGDYVFTILHKKWLKSIIREENFVPGDLYYLFCSDDVLVKYNITYLHHDTLTDIITFDEGIDNIVSGSILISLDRVSENAVSRRSSFESELLRVVVHGVLHLCGYKDKTKQEAQQMREREEAALQLYNRMKNS